MCSGCESLWNMVPGFAGVSLTQSLTLACTLSYYCVIIGLSIYYLVMSFYPTLPWTRCPDQTSSSVLCIPSGDDIKQYITCHPPDGRNDTICILKDHLPSSEMTNVTTFSSVELFFKNVQKEPEEREAMYSSAAADLLPSGGGAGKDGNGRGRSGANTVGRALNRTL